MGEKIAIGLICCVTVVVAIACGWRAIQTINFFAEVLPTFLEALVRLGVVIVVLYFINIATGRSMRYTPSEENNKAPSS
ncbi:hypothetical protein ACFL11_00445 [Patescibacteria group bacterium]